MAQALQEVEQTWHEQMDTDVWAALGGLSAPFDKQTALSTPVWETSAHSDVPYSFDEDMTGGMSSITAYKRDIAPHAQFSRLSPDEREAYKWELVEKARQGNREELIAYLLSAVVAQAERYAYGRNPQVDVGELIQVGNLALLEKLDVALTKPDPYAFVLAWTEAEIRRACFHDAPMHLSRSRSAERPSFVSLDQPVSHDDDRLLSEAIAAPVALSTEERDYDELYRLIEALPKAQRETILRRYGLCGMGVESSHEIDEELHAGKPNSRSNEQRALATLRYQLKASAQQYAPEESIIVSAASSVLPKCARIELKEAEQERLIEAHARLQTRGESLTVRKLAKEAHIAGEVASAYLHQQGLIRKQPDRLERLDAAYASMQAEGMAITAKTLALVAHTHNCHALSYLRQRGIFSPRSKEGIEARLEQTYQQMKTEGKPIMINALAEATHVAPEKASAYLKERRKEAGQPLVVKPALLPPGEKEARHQQWLEQAYKTLQQQGRDLTVENLRSLVSVSSEEAKVFLAKRGMTWKEQQEREREARLSASYAQLRQEAQPFGAEHLATCAQVAPKKARQFLRKQPDYTEHLARLKEREEQEVLHRLTLAYAHFQPQGGIRQRTSELAKLAGVSEAAARRFLDAQAGAKEQTETGAKARVPEQAATPQVEEKLPVVRSRMRWPTPKAAAMALLMTMPIQPLQEVVAGVV